MNVTAVTAPTRATRDPATRDPALSPIPRTRGESRTTVDAHVDADERTAARLVKVETSDVDQRTGKASNTYFEVTVNARGVPETARTFTHKRNAELAYAATKHGAADRCQRCRSDYT